MCWLDFMLIRPRQKREHQLKQSPPPAWPIGKCVVQFFLTDWCGKVQSIVGAAAPGQVVLDSMCKGKQLWHFISSQSEQKRSTKQSTTNAEGGGGKRSCHLPNTRPENPSFKLLIRVLQETHKTLQDSTAALGCLQESKGKYCWRYTLRRGA